MPASATAAIQQKSIDTDSRMLCIFMIEPYRIEPGMWDFGQKINRMFQEFPKLAWRIRTAWKPTTTADDSNRFRYTVSHIIHIMNASLYSHVQRTRRDRRETDDVDKKKAVCPNSL